MFEAQSKKYKLSVLPSGHPVLAIEAYNMFGWDSYSHEQFGLKGFGASGPYAKVYEREYLSRLRCRWSRSLTCACTSFHLSHTDFGLTGANVAEKAQKVVKYFKDQKITCISPLITALGDIAESDA